MQQSLAGLLVAIPGSTPPFFQGMALTKTDPSMFSLIITIISIALVAALALATLYYGGKAFNKGSATAEATKILTQGQQLQGAAELYKADTGAYPLTMQAMLDGKYLTSVPVASLSPETSPALMGMANAAATPWVMVLSGYPVFAVTRVSEAVCKSINLKAYGQEGILKTARTSFVTQCYGTNVNNLKMVTTKTGAMLITVAASPSAVISLGSVINDAVPAAASTDASAAGWLVAPNSTTAPPSPAVIGYEDGEGAAITALAFQNLAVGDSASLGFYVKNVSSEPLTFDQGTPTSAPFTTVYDDCTGATLAPSASCFMRIEFSPTEERKYLSSTYKVSLKSGGGSLPGLALSGGGGLYSSNLSMWFNGAKVGTVSENGSLSTTTGNAGFASVFAGAIPANSCSTDTYQLVLMNDGVDTYTKGAVTFQGSVLNTTCGATLGPNSNCSVTVCLPSATDWSVDAFTEVYTEGTYFSASYTSPTGAVNLLKSFFHYKNAPPSISVTTSSNNPGALNIGKSAQDTAVFRNTTAGPVALTVSTPANTNSASFSTTCGAVLPAYASCTIIANITISAEDFDAMWGVMPGSYGVGVDLAETGERFAPWLSHPTQGLLIRTGQSLALPRLYVSGIGAEDDEYFIYNPTNTGISVTPVLVHESGSSFSISSSCSFVPANGSCRLLLRSTSATWGFSQLHIKSGGGILAGAFLRPWTQH
jgi:hypothetical protein